MKNEAIIEKVKKNKQLSAAEKKELVAFWLNYICPANRDQEIEATYGDGEVARYTVKERLEFFYDETPRFIESFFEAMSKGEPFQTRFAVYTVVKY